MDKQKVTIASVIIGICISITAVLIFVSGNSDKCEASDTRCLQRNGAREDVKSNPESKNESRNTNNNSIQDKNATSAVKGTTNENNTEASNMETTLISPNKAVELIKENKSKDNFQIIDLRTEEEFKSGHLENSIMIDFYNPNFIQKVQKLDKNKTYLVYCRSGNRSASASQLLEQLGYNNIYDLAGGITSWQENKLPIVKI